MRRRTLHAANNFSFRVTFILLREPTEIHHYPRFHQNLTITFQVVGSVLCKNTEIARKVRGQGQISLKSVLNASKNVQ